MNFTITINAETPEELSAIVSRLNGVSIVQAPDVQAPAIQSQPSYQQHQAIAPTVAPQVIQQPVQQPVYTPDPSATYQAPVQQGYGQQQPIQQGYGQQPGQVPLASAPTYTMELLGLAAGPLIDAGRSPELLSWINQRGAGALTQLDKAHYGDFATYLRSLGGNI